MQLAKQIGGLEANRRNQEMLERPGTQQHFASNDISKQSNITGPNTDINMDFKRQTTR